MLNPFRRHRYPSAEELAGALLSASRSYSEHCFTWDELVGATAEALAEMIMKGQLGKLTTDEIDYVIEEITSAAPEYDEFYLTNLYWAFTQIDLSPVGRYGVAIIVTKGLGRLGAHADEALDHGDFAKATAYVDRPYIRDWEDQSPIPNAWWFWTKARVLAAAGRSSESAQAATEGANRLRAYVQGDAELSGTDRQQFLGDAQMLDDFARNHE